MLARSAAETQNSSAASNSSTISDSVFIMLTECESYFSIAFCCPLNQRRRKEGRGLVAGVGRGWWPRVGRGWWLGLGGDDDWGWEG